MLILPTLSWAETVKLKFTNIGKVKGRMAIAVFNDPQAFPDNVKKTVFTKFIAIATGSEEMVATIDLKPGSYAIAAYLDQNNNGTLDKNIMGIPKERFGFSKNPSVQFSAPNFAECEVDVVEGKSVIFPINLLKFL